MARELGFIEHGTGKHQSNVVWDIQTTSPAITTITGGGTQQIKILVKRGTKSGKKGICGDKTGYSTGICHL